MSSKRRYYGVRTNAKIPDIPTERKDDVDDMTLKISVTRIFNKYGELLETKVDCVEDEDEKD